MNYDMCQHNNFIFQSILFFLSLLLHNNMKLYYIYLSIRLAMKILECSYNFKILSETCNAMQTLSISNFYFSSVICSKFCSRYLVTLKNVFNSTVIQIDKTDRQTDKTER